MIAESHSSSELLVALLDGQARRGMALSRHDLRFGDYVIQLTLPRAPRMPNGIECRVSASRRARVVIGRGKLTVGRLEILPGPAWDPVPAARDVASLPAGPAPITAGVALWMSPSPAAAGALMAGYLAGLVLLHGQHRRAQSLALNLLRDTGPVAATLLMHAARGEVPEPIHDLLASGDASSLIAFSPSGLMWLRGLISAGYPLQPAMLPRSASLQKPA